MLTTSVGFLCDDSYVRSAASRPTRLSWCPRHTSDSSVSSIRGLQIRLSDDADKLVSSHVGLLLLHVHPDMRTSSLRSPESSQHPCPPQPPAPSPPPPRTPLHQNEWDCRKPQLCPPDSTVVHDTCHLPSVENLPPSTVPLSVKEQSCHGNEKVEDQGGQRNCCPPEGLKDPHRATGSEAGWSAPSVCPVHGGGGNGPDFLELVPAASLRTQGFFLPQKLMHST